PAVEHDRLRIVAGAAAHGEARIVGQHGVDAHQQRIVSRAQQVRHVEGFLRAEREGTRGTRGDAPVDALRIAEGDEGPAGRPPCRLATGFPGVSREPIEERLQERRILRRRPAALARIGDPCVHARRSHRPSRPSVPAFGRSCQGWAGASPLRSAPRTGFTRSGAPGRSSLRARPPGRAARRYAFGMAGANDDDRARERQAMLREIEADARATASLTGRPVFGARVMAAMAKVPRHRFVPAAWSQSAYQNRPLPIDAGQTISQPYIVALSTDLIDPEPDDVVL